MRALIITLFILGFVELTIQELRHIHVFAYRDEKPALHEFSRDKEQVNEAEKIGSTVELRARIIDLNAKLKDKEAGKDSKEIDKMKNDEPLYKEVRIFESEYAGRVDKAREVRDLWQHCGAGALLIALGCLLFITRQDWAGLASIMTGFTVIIYWSSPIIFGGGANAEHAALLISKMSITATALVIINVLFFAFTKRMSPERVPKAA